MSEHSFTEVMLDLETMGNGPDAAIVAIGAVAFDIETAAISPRGFYVRVDLKSAVEAGGVMDPDTVIWWLQQSEAARAEITRDDIERRLIVNALLDFRHWLKTEACGEDSRIWGNGAAFDNVILRRAYQRLPLAVPWSHWNDRCYRTIKGLYGRDIKIERTGVHHHALSDAEAQAAHLLRMLDSDLTPAHRSCNACDWSGPVSECVMLGSVGPLCPDCRETTDTVDTAGDAKQ